MIIRSTIDSECVGRMYYIHDSMGKKYKEYIPKYKTRLSEYESEKLIQSLQQDPYTDKIYLYKINYSDGNISLIAKPNFPIGRIFCEDEDNDI